MHWPDKREEEGRVKKAQHSIYQGNRGVEVEKAFIREVEEGQGY